jgi:hypothetical protein
MKVEWIDTKAGDVYTYIKNGERLKRGEKRERARARWWKRA